MNLTLIRNFEIASCRIDIPRITPQSPPIDEWFHLEKFDRRSRAWSEHLFPIAAGVKHAAEALEGTPPFHQSHLSR